MGYFEDRLDDVKKAANAIYNPIAQVQMIGNSYNRLPDKTKQDLATAATLNANTAAIGVGGGGIPKARSSASAQEQIPFQGANAVARNADLEAGYAKGKEIFYDDPDMQMLRKRREDLSKGYSGQELGALRALAERETEGARQSGLRKVQGNIARAGVGGARGAAIQAAADKGFLANKADLERKMTLDNANMVRQGTKDLQDYIFSQKYGQLGTGIGYGQLGVSDRSADAQARIANTQRDKNIFEQLAEYTPAKFLGLY